VYWIAVHEEVLGSKLRGLRKKAGCSEAEALGVLTLMWLWARKNADVTGLLGNADRDDIAHAISASLSKGLDAHEVTAALIEEGWIDDINGKLYVHDWYEWQQYWYNYLDKREKDKVRKRLERERAKSEAPKDDVQKLHSKSEVPVQHGKDVEKKEEESPKYSKAFEDFWEVYPRKVEKGNAYKKYCTRLKDGFSDEQLFRSAKNYADECEKLKTDAKYIKHPKTFLSDSTPFVDYLPKENKILKFESGKNPFESYK